MSLALVHQPSYLARLVSVDMAPSKGPVSTDFAKYLDAMREVNEAHVEKRSRAADILKKYEEVCRSASSTAAEADARISPRVSSSFCSRT